MIFKMLLFSKNFRASEWQEKIEELFSSASNQSWSRLFVTFLPKQNWCLRRKIRPLWPFRSFRPLCSSSSSRWGNSTEAAILNFLSKKMSFEKKQVLDFFLKSLQREEVETYLDFLPHPHPSNASDIRRETNRMPVVKNVHHFNTKGMR